MMQLQAIHCYPIKSCGGVSLARGVVDLRGVRPDRRLMVVSATGNFLTQRTHPILSTVQVTLVDGEGDRPMITLATAAMTLPPITFQVAMQGPTMAVQVWRDRTQGVIQAQSVNRWFQTLLSSPDPVFLVAQPPQALRAIAPDYAPTPQQPVSFADGFPLLLTTTASLQALNQHLHHSAAAPPVPMANFRPNLVITSDTPWIEETWREVTIGPVGFTVAKPCSRCVVITTDQTSGDRHPHQEPLRTLKTWRPQSQGVIFGMNLIPRHGGVITVGDTVHPQ